MAKQRRPDKGFSSVSFHVQQIGPMEGIARSRRLKAKPVDDLDWSARPNHIEFVYELSEPIECDVFELVPLLSSMGSLIQDAHRTLNPDGPDVTIKAKPFARGSFGIPTIIQYAHPTVAALFTLPIPQTAKYIYDTLKDLGLIAKAKTSVFDVIKKLGGKPEQVARTQSGYKASLGDQSVNVDKNTGKLLMDNRTYNHFYNIYAAPIEQGTAKNIRTYISDEPKTARQIDDRAVPALKEAANAPAVSDGKEKTKSRRIKASLHPKRGSFDEDGHQWSFKWGEQVIVATIKDKTFLRRYDAGEVRLNGHDTLNVIMLEKQKLVNGIVRSTTYEIHKVVNFIPGLKQQPLLAE